MSASRTRTIRRVSRGFLLVEMLLMVAAWLAVLFVIGKALTDAIYLQRVAAQHCDRMAVMDSLIHQLRRDLLAAGGHAWSASDPPAGGTLTLTGRAPQAAIEYTVGDAEVARVEDGTTTHVWRAVRLEFDAVFEPGEHSDLLNLGFVETPPPRATLLPKRIFFASFLLPTATPGTPP